MPLLVNLSILLEILAPGYGCKMAGGDRMSKDTRIKMLTEMTGTVSLILLVFN